MNILVAGGFGYIGSRLVSHLLARGHRVGVVGRSIPDYLADLAGTVDFQCWDIRDSWHGGRIAHYDLMAHLAAANDIDCADPQLALNVNVRGTRNCLELCRIAGIPRIIYFSTFQVFGISEGPVDESNPPTCRNDYALTHLFAEEYVRMYGTLGIVDFVVLRPTNVYGAPLHRKIDRWSLVPNCFCKEAFECGSITLNSSGRQHRDFISLPGLVERTTYVAENFERLRNSTLTLAHGQSITILDIARRVQAIYQQLFGKTCDLHVLSNEPAECKPLVVNATRLANAGLRAPNDSTLDTEIVNTFRLLRGH